MWTRRRVYGDGLGRFTTPVPGSRLVVVHCSFPSPFVPSDPPPGCPPSGPAQPRSRGCARNERRVGSLVGSHEFVTPLLRPQLSERSLKQVVLGGDRCSQ